MISELSGGGPAGFGVTGVTRLIDTGAPTGVTPFAVSLPLDGVVTSTITVPVCVPVGSPAGLANTVRLMPSGGRRPLDGSTRTSQGSCGSSEAVKGKVP